MQFAALYIRVSSDKQAAEGDSIPAQRDALRKYVNDHPGMICAGEYLDDGISGTKADRDELTRLLDDVKAGKITCILFTKLDRWFRSVRHYTATQEVLDKYGVTWTAIWEPIYDTSTPSGRLIVNQMMSIAQFEAENTGLRIRQVFDYKVKQGEVLSGRTPPGYSIVGKHLCPNDTASAVKKAFELYSLTGSINTVMAMTQGTGLPRTKPAFKHMLQNSKYVGTFRENDNYCPPIITRQLFDDVQRKLNMNVKCSQKQTYIFSGLLKCGECGASLGGNTRKRTRNGYVSVLKQYRCPKHYVGGICRCKNAKLVSEHALEMYLMDNIRPLIKDAKLKYTVKEKASPYLEKQKASISRKLDRLKELYVNEIISIDEYKQDREKFENEISLLNAAEAPQSPDFNSLDKIIGGGIEKLYWGLSDAEKRYFWRSIIREISMGIDRVYHVQFL